MYECYVVFVTSMSLCEDMGIQHVATVERSRLAVAAGPWGQAEVSRVEVSRAEVSRAVFCLRVEDRRGHVLTRLQRPLGSAAVEYR